MGVHEKYLDWMYDKVYLDKRTPSYKRLFEVWDSIIFLPKLRMDGNRADDGINLRYHFKQENHICSVDVDRYLCGECSVLEMMVALSLRVEDDIMDDPVKGNRTGEWFDIMLESLGLDMMVDGHFNEKRVRHIIYNFIDRNYKPDGTGGLFRIENCPYDLRNVEIWYQMCWYFDSIV